MINNSFMDNIGAIFVSSAITVQAYPLVRPHGLPYLHNIPGLGLRVKGELWLVPDYGMPSLDSLEGVPNHYNRAEINVAAYDEIFVIAQTYFDSYLLDEENIYLEEYTE